MKTGDFARFTRCSGLDGLEVMSARWMTHSFAPHMHDFYAISLNDGGRGVFDCRGARREATPGTCNLIAPGEVHTGRPTGADGWSYRNLYLEPGLMTTLLRSLDRQGTSDITFKAPLVRDPVLAALLARTLASLTVSGSLLQNESLLLAVVARLMTEHAVPAHAWPDAGHEHVAVRRVKEWLDANSEQNVSIQELAVLAGLSPYYLVRAFHREVGIPPHRYQAVVRIHRARTLLASGAAIAEVAYRTGFCDQSHLSRCFKRTLGVTPGRFVAAGPRGAGRSAPGQPGNARPPGLPPA